MKQVFTFLVPMAIGILLTASVFAQSPEKMSYQAVIRDASDNLVTSQAVGMQISILQGSASGTAVYVETQSPTTNANGLVSLEIGTGTTSDDFSSIDWANGPYFIKTETDPAGGTSYSITGTSQLLSVPYSLHSGRADSAMNVANSENWDKDVTDDFSGDYNDLTNKPASFDDADADSTNELQQIQISGDTLSLSNDTNKVVLPQGGKELVYFATTSGYENNPEDPLQFLTPPIEFTITSYDQVVYLSCTKSFGTTVGAGGLDLFPGYHDGSDFGSFHSGSLNMELNAGQRTMFAVSGTVQLPPGTYQFGMIGDDDGDGGWNSNEYGHTTLMVFE
jgi:hypothetical protein